MSTIFPIDHHATFHGMNSDITARGEVTPEWSSRQRVGFILISALASWIFVLSPFLLMD